MTAADRLPEVLSPEVLDELIAAHRALWPRLRPWTTPCDRSKACWLREQWLPLGCYERGAWRLAGPGIYGDEPRRLAEASFAAFTRARDIRAFLVGGHELAEGGFRFSARGWRQQSPELGMVPRGALELMREVLRLRWLERVLA